MEDHLWESCGSVVSPDDLCRSLICLHRLSGSSAFSSGREDLRCRRLMLVTCHLGDVITCMKRERRRDSERYGKSFSEGRPKLDVGPGWGERKAWSEVTSLQSRKTAFRLGMKGVFKSFSVSGIRFSSLGGGGRELRLTAD
ncbi:uncharacterized protein TNCV_4761641 [Trichonephila clavipes]|uniref:Uncharacterized protein n=1 Tax=Trichonephila clavipes TaxID=2585209 RepID=A0A8X6RMU9_TRICX|nr:uncharacterized protein TNCV_4761641 [Trichonephila clavipes]